jgi:hypothetical protein
MQLSLATDVSAQRVAAAEGAAPRCDVFVAARPFGPQVQGAVLEAAVRCDAWLLLFLSDDVPYEESLSIHLLDARGAPLDSARLGGAYSTGVFSALRLEPPDAVRFRFIGETDWRVQLLAQPQWRVPFVADAPGVHRSVGVSRHFVVHGNPQPADS